MKISTHSGVEIMLGMADVSINAQKRPVETQNKIVVRLEGMGDVVIL